MYNWDGVYQNKNITPGVNTKSYLVLHHTWSIGAGNLKILSGQGNSKVSVHFLITRDGKAFKLCWPDQIAWHAGDSQWGKLNWMNAYSIGIEIEGNDATPFTDAQYAKVVDVVKYLQTTFKIPRENVLKHSDITWSGSKDMRLRDGKSAARKTDVSPRLWKDRWYPNFAKRREQVLNP